jgi:hypothetical protein
MRIKYFTLLAAITVLLTSSGCEQYYDNRVLPITGVYEGSIIGFPRVFRFDVAANGGDDLVLEAPLDGQIWDVIVIDVDNKDNRRMDLDINFQTLEPGVTINGDGFFIEGRLQLNYTINAFGNRRNFRLIADQW